MTEANPVAAWNEHQRRILDQEDAAKGMIQELESLSDNSVSADFREELQLLLAEIFVIDAYVQNEVEIDLSVVSSSTRHELSNALFILRGYTLGITTPISTRLSELSKSLRAIDE